MKRTLSIILCLLLLASLLTACGGSASEYTEDIYYSAETEAPMEEAGDGIASSTSISEYSDPSAKLIRNVSLDAQTQDYDALMTAVEQKITALEGYIESRDAYNGSEYYGRGTRYCSMVIRIPAPRLDEFITYVNDSANVVNLNETVENVTLQYADTAARVEALETEQARLLELLEQAADLTAVLQIEDRLSEVRYELSSYGSQLRVLDNQVSYATVRLYIDEVEKLTPVEEPTVWQRITEGFGETLTDIADVAMELFVWIVVNSPWLCIWAVILTAAVLLTRRGRKKRKEKKAPVIEEQSE